MADKKSGASWGDFQAQIVARAMKDRKFRNELEANPKSVLDREMKKLDPKAFLPKELDVKIVPQPSNTLCLVLPEVSKGGELSDAQLAKVAGGYDEVFSARYPGNPVCSCPTFNVSGSPC